MKKKIRRAVTAHRVDYLNDVLYKMCQEIPRHTDNAEIYAKLAIIGRTYAAALERTSVKGLKSNVIFDEAISKLMRHKKLDKLLAVANKIELPTNLVFNKADLKAIWTVIEAHTYLEKVLRGAAKTCKRSLASKYLHFHLPEHYPIFDTHSVHNITKYTKAFKKYPLPANCDEKYTQFFIRILTLRNSLNHEYGTLLSMRQIDNLLLAK